MNITQSLIQSVTSFSPGDENDQHYLSEPLAQRVVHPMAALHYQALAQLDREVVDLLIGWDPRLVLRHTLQVFIQLPGGRRLEEQGDGLRDVRLLGWL